MSRTTWDTRVFSKVPPPGFPAYVHVHQNGRAYAANYTDLTGDDMPARVFEWTADATLLRSWTVPGQDLSVPRGVQVATSDARGRLVLLEKSRRRVMTLDVDTGEFLTHAALPEPAIPNYATWGPEGALYVSDYGQGVIWRLPAGGGAAERWCESAKLSAPEFGTTGLVYRPAEGDFLISQQTTGDAVDIQRGHLYRLTVEGDGGPGELTTLWSSQPMELPDGFGIAASGAIYLSLLGANQLVRLDASGRETERFPRVPLAGDNGSPVTFDGPSNATFHGTRVLVANQSPVEGNADHHVILDVEVGERGATPHLPENATL